MGSGWGTAGLGRWHVRLDRHIWGLDGRMGLGGHTWGGNAWICGVGVEAHGIGMDGCMGLDRHIWGWDGRMGLGGHTWGGNAWIWGVGVEARGIGMDGYVGLGWMDTWGWDGQTWDWMDTNGVGRDTHGGEMDTWGWDECTWG